MIERVSRSFPLRDKKWSIAQVLNRSLVRKIDPIAQSSLFVTDFMQRRKTRVWKNKERLVSFHRRAPRSSLSNDKKTRRNLRSIWSTDQNGCRCIFCRRICRNLSKSYQTFSHSFSGRDIDSNSVHNLRGFRFSFKNLQRILLFFDEELFETICIIILWIVCRN